MFYLYEVSRKPYSEQRRPGWLLVWWLYIFALLIVLSGCGTPKTATDSPKEDYYLSVEEAQAMPSATDAETISAQGSPTVIEDPEAYFGKAYKFLRTGDELVWTPRSLSGGSYEIQVNAKAELYGDEAPALALTIGTQQVTKSFGSEQYQTVSYGNFTYNPNDTIKITFTNDAWGGSAETDRNILLSHLYLKLVPTNPDPP
ncbi:MAG: carbohydrate-binding domain-containing protein, partial [Trueperaceae bacterium]